MATVLLQNCRFVVTQNPKREILEHVDIEIEKESIKRISKKRIKTTRKQTIINCSNKIVLPGLINTHTHIGMHSLRGICDDEELHEWLKKVVAAEKRFSTKHVEQNAMHACKEILLSGTTTVMEMYTPIAPILSAVKKSSIRAILCPVIYGFLGNMKEQLKYAKKMIETTKEKRIKIGLGAHSLYTCDTEILKAIKEIAKEKNLLTPIHLAETRKERFDCFDTYKKLPAEYLAAIDFMDKNTVLVHSIWLTKGEVRVIAQHNAKVSHCPVSNMKLSSGGVTPLMEMFEEKVVVGLGTDSVASNNSMDMFKEMMIAGLLHKHHRWDSKAAPVQKLLDMATIDGAKVVGMEKEIGSLEEGKKADIIAIDIAENHWPLNTENIVSHLVYATTGKDVCDVLVDGKIVVRKKVLC